MERVKLSGFCRAEFNIGYWTDETADGFIIRINDKNYAAYVNPDDGYRSYGCFFETDQECTNTFEPQDVLLEKIEDSGDSTSYEDPRFSYWRILNPDTKELILEVGTIWYDSYYPMGRCYFDPTKMPINK